MTVNDRQEPTLAAYAELAAVELKRRFGVPFPDGLQPDVRRGHAARTSVADLVDQWGKRFDLSDLPPRVARS